MVQTVTHSVKADFDKLTRSQDHRNIILEAVGRAHRTKTHVLQFLKEYLLSLHAVHSASSTSEVDYIYMQSGDAVEEQPDMEYDYETVLTSNLVDSISAIVCEPSVRGRKPSEVGSGNLRSVLSDYYDEYYQDGLGLTELPRSVPRTHLATYFDYFSKEVVTVYKSNISMHYKEHVKRYFEYTLGKEEMIDSKKFSPSSMTQVELTEVEVDWSTNYDLVVRDVLCMEFQVISDERVYSF